MSGLSSKRGERGVIIWNTRHAFQLDGVINKLKYGKIDVPKEVIHTFKFTTNAKKLGVILVALGATGGIVTNQVLLDKRVTMQEAHYRKAVQAHLTPLVTAEPTATPSAIATPTAFIPTKALLRTIVPTINATISK